MVRAISTSLHFVFWPWSSSPFSPESFCWFGFDLGPVLRVELENLRLFKLWHGDYVLYGFFWHCTCEAIRKGPRFRYRISSVTYIFLTLTQSSAYIPHLAFWLAVGLTTSPNLFRSSKTPPLPSFPRYARCNNAALRPSGILRAYREVQSHGGVDRSPHGVNFNSASRLVRLFPLPNC